MQDLALARDPQVYEPAEDSWLLARTLVHHCPRPAGLPSASPPPANLPPTALPASAHSLHGAVLEIGTGCGVVALALARCGARVTATDANPAAVALARRNATANGLAVEVLAGDLYEPVAGRRFDAIVCNPPYLPPGETYHDPALALAVEGGPTGGEFTARLLVGAPAHLRAGGAVWLLCSSRMGELPAAGWRCEVLAEERYFGERLRVERWVREA